MRCVERQYAACIRLNHLIRVDGGNLLQLVAIHILQAGGLGFMYIQVMGSFIPSTQRYYHRLFLLLNTT
jgi:hypothetical protein